MEKTIETAKDFKSMVGKNDFVVNYRKKGDGKFRRGEGSLVLGKELVKGTQNEEVKHERDENGIVNYFDKVKNGWRSFDVRSMIRLEFAGQIYQFGM